MPAEVTEATSVLIHLQKLGCEVECFAPDMLQRHHIYHNSGDRVLCPPLSARYVMEESARICRGNVRNLKELAADEFDAVVIPGGFGVAKNLCTFALAGPDFAVHPEIERAIHAFHSQGKPIGLCCIAPVLAAKLLPGCTVTVGGATESKLWPNAAVASAVEAMGASHVETPDGGLCVDEENLLMTTPAFMANTTFASAYDGVGRVCDAVVARA